MPRSCSRALAVAVLIAFASGAAGCGGDTESTSTPSVSASAEPSNSASASPSTTPTTPTTPDEPVVVTTGPNPGISSDFPTEQVPIVAGDVVLPLGLGTSAGDARGWVLQLESAKTADACFSEAAKILLGAGFILQGERKDEKLHEAQFTKPGYAVIISAATTESGGCRLGYEVGELGRGVTQ